MPIDVFVDFFFASKNKITKIMIVVENVNKDTMLQCVDRGWDTKE